MPHYDTDLNPNHTSARMQEEGTPYLIPATEYATAWACPWTDPAFEFMTEHDLELLKHVNCSYLSSGKPPTLLSLKQHAQSLAILIKKLCVSNTFGIIDGKGKRHPAFQKNDAFDWLNDLDEPYTNDDESHHMSLLVLTNQIKKEDEETGIECHCPLEVARNWNPLEPGGMTCRPYHSHHNLVMHANACLEILDHEYSATGGITSLLPAEDKDDDDQMSAARNTLLGQLFLHQQHMVARMHDLEISYANAVDALQGEAVVPLQMLHSLGAEGRLKGRELVYHQDRLILVNAGDDVFDLIHHMMDEKESQMQSQEHVWWEAGVNGERMRPKTTGGESYSRGLVSVDLMARFQRVKGHGGGSTIFMIPAIEHHPGTTRTREIEGRPTVVSVVAPSWPERASDLKKREEVHLERAKVLEDENHTLARNVLQLKASLEVALADLRKTKQSVRFYEGTSEGATSREILSDNEAMRHQMAELRRALPREYHHLLEAED
ncbi:hypothetical protein V8C35DRAFT_302361 [Trichoderma chlorosporum]